MVIQNSYFTPPNLQGNGPLAEIDLWRVRNAVLSDLNEQTKLPEVEKVLTILQEAESECVTDLHIVFSDLRERCVEALDNVRFLSTLEHHLKVCDLKKTLCRSAHL